MNRNGNVSEETSWYVVPIVQGKRLPRGPPGTPSGRPRYNFDGRKHDKRNVVLQIIQHNFLSSWSKPPVIICTGTDAYWLSELQLRAEEFNGHRLVLLPKILDIFGDQKL